MAFLFLVPYSYLMLIFAFFGHRSRHLIVTLKAEFQQADKGQSQDDLTSLSEQLAPF